MQAAAGPLFVTVLAKPLSALNKAQLLRVCHNQWDDISQLVITKRTPVDAFWNCQSER